MHRLLALIIIACIGVPLIRAQEDSKEKTAQREQKNKEKREKQEEKKEAKRRKREQREGAGKTASGQVGGTLNGIPYVLPKTGLRIELQVERVTAKQGTFCQFRDLFFPELDERVKCGKSDVQTLIKGYSVTPIGIPDPTRIHLLPSDGSWRIARADSITLTEGGVLTGVDSKREDKTTEIVFGILGNVASVIGKLIGVGADGLSEEEMKEAAKLQRAEVAKGYFWEADERLKENFRALKDVRQQEYKNWAGGNTEERKQLRSANLVYSRWKLLAENLNAVLGGNGAEAATTLISELGKQMEADLSTSFLGIERTAAWSPVYEWIPSFRDPSAEAAKEEKFEPFTFAECGIVEEKQQPLANSLTKLRCAESPKGTPQPISFIVKAAELKNDLSKQIKTKYPSLAGKVFYYTIPAAASLSVSGTCAAGNKNVPCNFGPTSVLLAQWGHEAVLPDVGRDAAVVISLYAATGALQNVKVTTKALLDKEMIDQPFKALNTILDAKLAADAKDKIEREAEDERLRTEADDLTKLLRRQKLAEAAAAIAEKCKNLDPKPGFCQE